MTGQKRECLRPRGALEIEWESLLCSHNMS